MFGVPGPESGQTNEFLKIPDSSPNKIFQPHRPLAKAGVLMQHLQGVNQLQQHLWVPCTQEEQQKRETLMDTIDRLNHRYGRGTVQWAACGLHPNWAMRRERLGRASTTRLDELPMVHC